LGRVYLNPFTGFVRLTDLKIYESKGLDTYADGDTVFFTAKGLSVNFSMVKLFSGTIELSEVTLDRPRGIVIQDRKELNFTDIIKRFTPENPGSAKAGMHFNILNIRIIDGTFRFREKLIPIDYSIKGVNLASAGKLWNADTIAARISFFPGSGSGDFRGDFTIDFKTLNYRYSVLINRFDLNIIGQYLKDLTNNGSFSANLDADLKATGNLKNVENLTTTGHLAINDFHFGKDSLHDLASFGKLVMDIVEISPEHHKYLFDSVSVIRPFFKFERYEGSDNLQKIFGKNGSKVAAARADPARFNLVIEIARYVKQLSVNFFQSDYKINRLAIYKGDLKFNDFALLEQFSVDLDPLFIRADSIDKLHDWVDVDIRSGIAPYGSLLVKLRINPKDSTDFDLQYHLQHLPASLFNPYLVTYTSYPLDRGTIELNGTWNVRDGFIKSENHVVIIDPRVTRRVKNKGARWLPLNLIMALVRERGNVIDYEIPITGNIKNPEFNLTDILLDMVKNIFVKPLTTPYRMQVKTVETEIEKSLTVKWRMRQNSMDPDQEKFVGRIADFLDEDRAAFISVSPQQYAAREKESILFFEAKKKYFLAAHLAAGRGFNEDDSEKVDKMSITDSLFLKYIHSQVSDTALITRQEQCTRLVGTGLINARFIKLNRERLASFMLCFKKKGLDKRVKLSAGVNLVPYDGYSFYKIEYKGEFPESLIRASNKLNKLNDVSPRRKFKRERAKSKLAGLP
ncbi:MAG: DUF748 domain-containing protein, partial [Bacteroidota bacterium]